MVNTGHPSKACKLCRSRRIKCDETKPACLKCAKANRVCPGYRDAFEINLRDETQSTIRKAKSAAIRKASKEGLSITADGSGDGLINGIAANSPDWPPIGRQQHAVKSTANSSSSSSSSPSASASPSSSSSFSQIILNKKSYEAYRRSHSVEAERLPRGLDTPLDEQATCFFLSNYVLVPPAGVGHGIFTFLIPLIDSPRYKASPMNSAFTAVSMAALAGRPNSRSLFSVAHTHYSIALEQLTRAMQDQDQAKQDTSLAASILLAFYEGLANDEYEMSTFSKHISGAAAMIKLRGPRLIESPLGVAMFEVVRGAAIRQYMFFSECSIEDIKWALTLPKRSSVPSNSQRKRELLMVRSSSGLKRVLRRGSKVLNVGIYLHTLFSVLTLSQYLFDPYTVIPSQISTLTDMSYKNLTAYPNLEIYTYPNVWAAGKYITTHVSRLLLAQVTARCIACTCHPADPFHTEEYRKVQAIGREQVEEIISSTPYLTGWAGDSTTTPYFPCGTAEMPKGLASVTCMWPLLAAGMSRFADRSQRAFVKGRLTHIGEMMGIRQAEVFSKNIDINTRGPDRHTCQLSDLSFHFRH
ncbi:Transcriptional regulatory protein moc3 like [Verticillium longisporum]|nr:Transcriptional regulatory protein moc3 like [Verticillium longisporum]